MGDRAAVVIGVDKTGTLQPLKSAAAGAHEVASWLKAEGFDVKLLTDKAKPVTARAIADALVPFVQPPIKYRMLVVYFSGHGIFHAWSDTWLLSDAPVIPGEAVNLTQVKDAAKRCGVPNVVIISDACRSLPASIGDATLTPQNIFPSFGAGKSKVDVFRATSEARPAYEGKVAGKVRSVLTAALQGAYRDPPGELTLEVDLDGARVKVVPNRKIDDVLQDRVNDILAAIDPNLVQELDIEVPSDDDVYIARASFSAKAAEGAPKPAKPPRLGLNAANPPKAAKPPKLGLKPAAKPVAPAPVMSISRAAGQLARQAISNAKSGKPLSKAMTKALERLVESAIPAGPRTSFESQSGFVIHGASLKHAQTWSKGQYVRAEPVEPGNAKAAKPAILRIWTGNEPGASVAVELGDGRSLLLAALRGYIGHCQVDENGLANVSYVPSENTPRWNDYMLQREEVDRRRAEIAVAANHNSFKLNSAEAAKLGVYLRDLKALDPTLGLYAAYAYWQAGDEEQIASVHRYMANDLQAALFDVRLLAFRVPANDGLAVLPHCPMLTQSWNLLGARHARLPAALQGAMRHLTGSLWTTFNEAFTPALFAAAQKGDV